MVKAEVHEIAGQIVGSWRIGERKRGKDMAWREKDTYSKAPTFRLSYNLSDSAFDIEGSMASSGGAAWQWFRLHLLGDEGWASAKAASHVQVGRETGQW